MYLTTRRKYLEVFINDKQLERDTASVDFGVGMATLPFVREDQVTNFTVSTGILSSGSAETPTNYLRDGRSETAFIWNGAQVELLLAFDEATIVNRLRIELDDYQGLAVVDILTSSPDGILVDDASERPDGQPVHRRLEQQVLGRLGRRLRPEARQAAAHRAQRPRR